MIPTTSQSSHTITVSVGQEILVREGHKSVRGKTPSLTERKDIAREESKAGVEFPKSDQIQEVLLRLQKTLQHVEPRIELSVDKELNQVIFRFFDKESGDLIRQIPSEKVLELQRFFVDQSGLIVEEEA